ncbi:MAG: hypothetical protein FJY73_04920 [Candidatus Eisenbacteria bacterium]|nr:hypothetical protein [Candidatus Eisenbacteria bacterium]
MKKMKPLVLAAAIHVFAGCSDQGGPVDPGNTNGNGNPAPAVSYREDVQPIWNANCAGCHGTSGGLTLVGGNSRSALVGVVSVGYAPEVRVVPGDPGRSVLYQKLLGNPDFGQRMPAGGALGGEDLETIRAWIAEGAADN